MLDSWYFLIIFFSAYFLLHIINGIKKKTKAGIIFKKQIEVTQRDHNGHLPHFISK